MNLTIIALLLAVGLASSVQAASASSRSTDGAFSRFIGTWNMELQAHEETFGEHSGPGTGTMTCDWGLMKAWVDCQMDSLYEGLGKYSLKIVLYRLRNDDEIGAFVTNSFGGGRLYEGAFDNAGDLVFNDAWVDPAHKWQNQRTVYSFKDDGSIHYSIDMSNDGTIYLPHSSGVYRRASN